MSYSVILSPEAAKDLAKLRKNEPNAFTKAFRLLDELKEHPRTGAGKPEPLSGDRAGQWSRRITQKHRMVYSIEDEIVEVFVLSSYGHYSDR
jgi:toxin YoeB